MKITLDRYQNAYRTLETDCLNGKTRWTVQSEGETIALISANHWQWGTHYTVMMESERWPGSRKVMRYAGKFPTALQAFEEVAKDYAWTELELV